MLGIPSWSNWAKPKSAEDRGGFAGSDYYETLKIIAYYRNCVKESELIRKYVSFHFVTPTKHISKKGIFSSKEATEYAADCSMTVPGFHNNIKTYR